MRTYPWVVAPLVVVAISCIAYGQAFQPPGTGNTGKEFQPIDNEALRAAPRPWDLSVRLFLIHDDNVLLIPEATIFTGDESAVGYGVSVDFEYRFIQKDDWVAGATLSFAQSGYSGSNPGVPFNHSDQNDFNLTTVTPGVYVRYLFDVKETPMSAGMSYAFRRDWRSKEAFTKVHTLQWDVSVSPSPDLSITGFYSVAFESHDLKRLMPALDSRDGTRHVLGASGEYWFDRNRRAVSLGYQFIITDTDGANFEADAHAVTLGFKTQVYGPVWLALDAAFAFEDYKNGFISFIPPPGRRRQDIIDFSATILWQMTQNVSLDVFYNYTRWNSNSPNFDAERHAVGAGVTYRF